MTTLKVIGKAIIIVTFIASLNPYLLIFTAPVFILGTILLWFSKSKFLTKTLWTILPVILWFPAFYLFMYLSGTIGTATAQKLDFIFPLDFVGKVIIIEKIPCGQPPKVVDGREQLFIPKNGILLYQGELKAGYVNHKYYRLQANDQKIELPERSNYMYFDSVPKKPNSKIVGAWLLGTGSKTLNEPKPVIEYSFMYLLVSSNDSTEKYYEFNYVKDFENLTDSLIRHCK